MISNAVEENGHQSKAKVFISYSRKDIAFADRLETALKARGFEPLRRSRRPRRANWRRRNDESPHDQTAMGSCDPTRGEGHRKSLMAT
jgi:hypothetical protein